MSGNQMNQINKRNERLGRAISRWCVKHHFEHDVRIYFNGYCYEWHKEELCWVRCRGLISLDCPYAPDGTVGVIFKGRLYEVLHKEELIHPLSQSFANVFARYNSTYILNHTWCLTSMDKDLY